MQMVKLGWNFAEILSLVASQKGMDAEQSWNCYVDRKSECELSEYVAFCVHGYCGEYFKR